MSRESLIAALLAAADVLDHPNLPASRAQAELRTRLTTPTPPTTAPREDASDE